MRVTYVSGPSKYLRANPDGERVEVGGELDLEEAQIAYLMRRDHHFEPVDKRYKLPDPEPAEMLPSEQEETPPIE